MFAFKDIIFKEGILYLVEVPTEFMRNFDFPHHLPVKGFIDGKPFKSTCMPRKGKRYVMFVNTSMRAAIGKKEDDTVSIQIAFDPESRDIPLPEDVEFILSEDEEILQEFLNTSPSYQRELTKYILQAKHEETRLKRINILVQRMRERIQKRK